MRRLFVLLLAAAACASPVTPTNTSGSAGISCPSDATPIAFSAGIQPPFEIVAECSDGSNRTVLASSDQEMLSPAWSPDGGTIAFVADSDERPPASSETGPLNEQIDLFMMNADGSEVRQITDTPGVEGWPAFSPDGSHLAFVQEIDGNYEIVVGDASGSDARNLTNDPALDYAPSWSPDGSQIVFYSTYRTDLRDPDIADPADANLFVMNADGSDLVQLTSGPPEDVDPAWSPDGRWIAFARAPYARWDLFRIRSDGSDLEHITDTPDVDELDPSWSPDGRWLAFVSARSPGSSIWRLHPDGSGRTQVTEGDSDRGPTFQPQGSSVGG